MRAAMLRLKREEITGGPLLDSGLRGWIVSTAYENLWRVYEWYDLSDLIQEGLLCYVKCLRRYSFLDEAYPTDEERRWFMSLVCTSYIRRIHDLANGRTLTAVEYKLLDEELRDNNGERNQIFSVPDGSVAHPACMLLLAEAPLVLQRLVAGLVRDVTGNIWRSTKHMTGTLPRVHRGKRRVRETLNQYYCRLAGVDPEQVDLRSLVDVYFGSL